MTRILFVADNINVLDGIRRMLHADRKIWELEFVLSGEAALQSCEAGRFDVVVSDMRMPGMDGATLLGHVRDRYPETARIALSGYSDEALTARSLSVVHRFLVKPCNVSELRTTIERMCTLQELLNKPDIRRIIGTVGELPSLSSTYVHLTRVIKDPNASIAKVATIIEQDVAMSAKVLHLVNSAFFGLARSVTNLSEAVSLLGMETTKSLVLVTDAFKAFVPDKRVPQSTYESLERHAQEVACIASALPLEREERDVAVIAALLHDIGRLFMASKMPEEFCYVQARTASGACKLFEAEEELLGTSHAEIGAYLLGLWGIPNVVVEAIAHHHRPTRIPHTAFDSTMAVYVAELFASENDVKSTGLRVSELDESDRDCLESLGILSRYKEFSELTLSCRK